LAQLRRHHLLDQVGFPVGGGPDRPEVPGLHAVLAQRGHHPGHRERFLAVQPAHPADQAVVLELGQLRVTDSRRLEQLAPGQLGRCPHGPGPAVSGRAPQATGTAETARARGNAAGEPFPDHLQRQIRIALNGQDVAQPLDVVRGEPAVTRSRPGRLDKPFGLQEADLGRAEVRKFRVQLRQHLADTELTARGLIAHA
jgi:hypothetical protein